MSGRGGFSDDSIQCKITKKILNFWDQGAQSLVNNYEKELKQRKTSMEEHQKRLLSDENALGIYNPNYIPAYTKPSDSFNENGYSSAEWEQCKRELQQVRLEREQYDKKMTPKVVRMMHYLYQIL